MYLVEDRRRGSSLPLRIIRLLAETVGIDKNTASIKAMSSVLGNALYRSPDVGEVLFQSLPVTQSILGHKALLNTPR
jgi:hypothetical protein